MEAYRDLASAADALIDTGRYIHSRGWVPATSGNLSARLADGSIAITVSGRHKGRLSPGDIMRVDGDGQSLDSRHPSAETLLHTALYRRYPHVHSVLHPHTVHAVLAARWFGCEVVFEDFELLKAFHGINTHATSLIVPIFPNDQDIARLASDVDEYLSRSATTHAYIISGHGFYTWGRSVEEALRHLEALEFLLECACRLKGEGR